MTPLTAKEKLEHIAECPDGCGVCKLMANDVRARIAELEAALKQRDEFTNTNCPVCHYWPCKCPAH